MKNFIAYFSVLVFIFSSGLAQDLRVHLDTTLDGNTSFNCYSSGELSKTYEYAYNNTGNDNLPYIYSYVNATESSLKSFHSIAHEDNLFEEGDQVYISFGNLNIPGVVTKVSQPSRDVYISSIEVKGYSLYLNWLSARDGGGVDTSGPASIRVSYEYEYLSVLELPTQSKAGIVSCFLLMVRVLSTVM